MPSAPAETTTATPTSTGTSFLPGLGLALGAGLLVVLLHQVVPALSPLLVAILLGVVITNVWTLPAVLQPGIAVAGKRVLRIGIVVLGLQLSLRDIAGLGAGVLLVVVAVVFGGIATSLLWGHLLGVPLAQRILIACGFSICGAAAVAAADGVIDAEEEEVATGIALVVLFGTLMIPIAPLVGSLLGFDLDGRATFAGASVHEVAQVVAAGGIIGGGALAGAVLVKLARVLMLAPVLAGLGLWHRRHSASTGGTRPPLVPLFVVGFLVAVLLRSFGNLPDVAISGANTLQTFLLAAAMFALGLGVRVSALRKVGGRTLVLGVLSTVSVATIAAVGVALTGA